MPKFLDQITYNIILKQMNDSVKVVANKLFQKAAEEDIKENSKAQNVENDTNLTVSGTWKKRGFSSLYGVSSLIGSFTRKVLDINVKTSYCKRCEIWKKKKALQNIKSG